jgi:hypothetical protein
MRRALLIFLSLVIVLVGWTTVYAEDGFYVVGGMKGKYAPVPKTGQTTPYALGDDGTLQKGVALPSPRFTDNGNGTVTDKLTGLIWMKNANAFGLKTWVDALSAASGLKSGDAGLTDGSQAGDWRLPNVRELLSLVDFSRFDPGLPADHQFSEVQSSYYWSSTTNPTDGATGGAYAVYFGYGAVATWWKSYSNDVWCVRGGK